MNINVAKSDRKVPVLPWSSTIEAEMASVDDSLREMINSAVPTAFELSQHLLDAGGKRLRPALVILCAKACGNHDAARAICIAACCEMIHMASLVHDDVIDRTDSRRGRITANAYWGSKVAVLSGDYLLSKAFFLLSQDGDLRVLREISQMTVTMSESEVLQAVCEGNLAAWDEHYWDIVNGKTARFMETCCRLGATIAEADAASIEALGKFGQNIGIAFQITDDLLDIIGDPSQTGKPFGTDLIEGKTTLPILVALKESDDSTRGMLLGLLNSSSLGREDIDVICQSVVRCGAVEKVRRVAADFIDRGFEALQVIPNSDAREALWGIASHLISRTR